MSRFLKLDPTIQKDVRETRAFYYLLLFVILFIYGASIYESPDLRQPLRLIPFTLLMLCHAVLHWFSPYFVYPHRRLTSYLVVQITLVTILCLISRGQAANFGLVMALAGETIGMLEDWRRSLVAAVGYLVLLMFINYLIGGWQYLPTWLGTAVIMLVFVLIYVLLFIRQISARQEAQTLLAELEGANLKLTEYAQQVEALTLETERQRMARELHDTLAQGLAGLVLQIEGLEVHLEQGDTKKVAEIAAHAKTRARNTLAEARQVIGDLRENSDMHPTEAILNTVERFQKVTGIPCSLSLPKNLNLPRHLEDHVVRGISEGLANVMQHARATEVKVSLAEKNNHLHISIRDNGIGFDAGQIPAGHYGLVGLRERARLVGGKLSIDTQSGQGTILDLLMPLSNED